MKVQALKEKVPASDVARTLCVVISKSQRRRETSRMLLDAAFDLRRRVMNWS